MAGCTAWLGPEQSQCRFQLLGGRLGERRQKPALRLVAGPGGVAERGAAGRGQFDEVPPPALRIRVAGQEPLALEPVEQADLADLADRRAFPEIALSTSSTTSPPAR